MTILLRLLDFCTVESFLAYNSFLQSDDPLLTLSEYPILCWSLHYLSC